MKIEEVILDADQPVGRVNNKHLPAGSKKGGIFRKKYIPSIFYRLASVSDPWNIQDDEACIIMNEGWKANYKNLPHTIVVDNPVFKVVRNSMLL